MKKLSIAVATSALLLLASVDPTTVAAADASSTTMTKASGTWSWVNTGWDTWRTTSDGTEYVSGTEDGTWTGTFAGTSADAFDGTIRPDGSLWGLLRIAFTGKVAGKSGTLEILTTWSVPRSNTDAPMTGRWRVVGGTGDLAKLRGQGSWEYAGSDPDHANYQGVLTFIP